MISKLFNNIEYSIDWGLLFGFISILSLVIAFFVKKYNSSKKEISIKEVYIRNLLNRPNELENELKIFLNGSEIEQLNKILLYIRNSGTSTLNSNDFHVLPKINLSGFTNIISLNVSSSNEFVKCETIKLESSIVQFKLDNIEPKDYVRIEILFESISDEFDTTFEYRLKEQKSQLVNLKNYSMDKELGVSNDYNAFLIFPFLAFIIVNAICYFIVKLILKIDITDLNKINIGWKVIYWTPSATTALYVIYKWYNFLNDFHYGHSKIDKWFSFSSNKDCNNIK